VARVWDMRSKAEIHVLMGHKDCVSSVLCNSVDPQVITASHDSTIKMWDLASGRSVNTLTHHKKGVRSLAANPREASFVSASADGIKKWQLRDGKFLKNFSGHDSVVNSVAVNDDGVCVSGGDNGSMRFWDYGSGYCFQSTKTVPQPGSLDAEAGIFNSAFDLSGSRYVTCETDKTIKIWKENEEATEESHPVDMDAWEAQAAATRRFR
jgi:pleiotropic regulator 1